MEESVVEFFEQWAEEFARAVEMFTGERPVVAQKAAETSQIEDVGSASGRVRLVAAGDRRCRRRFKAWVGAQEACFSALGGDRG